MIWEKDEERMGGGGEEIIDMIMAPSRWVLILAKKERGNDAVLGLFGVDPENSSVSLLCKLAPEHCTVLGDDSTTATKMVLNAGSTTQNLTVYLLTLHKQPSRVCAVSVRVSC